LNSDQIDFNDMINKAEGYIRTGKYQSNFGARVSDEFICKVARNSDEAVELIELGFEYVNEINGSFLYRKRK